jgi:Fe-S cluster assembly protein SufB
MRDENQLHAAVVELVALDDAEIKYSTVQNWYPGDAEGKGGIYNFVTKRGDCRGALEDLVDAGRDRLGDHLEVPELHPARRRLGRASSTRSRSEQPPAGRHRHQDDPHRQEHASTIISKGISAGKGAEHLPRPREDHRKAPRARATTRSATRC